MRFLSASLSAKGVKAVNSEIDKANEKSKLSDDVGKNYLGICGVLFTVVYIIGISYFQWDRLADLSNLELNEFGDFFAGVLGPLAILWLVIGFFQQGTELRNSAKALTLQADELKASVEQQSQLAETAKDQFDLQQKEFNATFEELVEAKKPNFVVSYRGIRQSKHEVDQWEMELIHDIDFANIGGTACEVKIFLGYGVFDQGDGPIVIWPQFKEITRAVSLYASDTHGDTIQLDLTYKDAMGKSHHDEYHFTRVTHGKYPKFEIGRAS
jgi:hypothetical protein